MGLGWEPHGNASERLGVPCTRASDNILHTLNPKTLNPKTLNTMLGDLVQIPCK